MAEGKLPSGVLRTIALLGASFTLLCALLTFVGWVSGLQLLASVRARYIPMAPSTALCFSLLGIGLLLQLQRPGRRWIPRLLAAAVLLLALAKVAEFLSGRHSPIDIWFVRNPEMFGAVPTGRMAPLTAVDFIFTALGLFALTGGGFRQWAGALGAIGTIISAVILVGYWYGTPLLYGGRIIPVALSTAWGFFLCGLAIVASAGAAEWPLRTFLGKSTRAVLLRAFVPVIIAAALINGWVGATLLKTVRTNPAVVSALGALAFAFLITAIVSQVSRVVGGRIDRAEAARNRARAELLKLNAQLEERVEKRTRELREKNLQMEEELQMARELQVALLPQKFPTIPAGAPPDESALGFLSLYFPTGDVSGDFFSVFPVGEKAAGVLICDVMGHGVRSALVTGMIRGLVEEHSQLAHNPGELLTRINRALTVILKQAGTTMFATCFYVVADVQRAELRFANAGHPSALHLRRDGASAEKLDGQEARGPAMGIFSSAHYSTSTRAMGKGDLVMLFTDGLFEVEDATGAFFTEEELRTTVSRHAALAPEEFFNRVLADIRRYSQSETFADDVCVVGMQIRHTE
ncbi:MAG TPA: SpoIIE family protein phosphatase [Chthoniobacterales bacterium]|nr:SpoIIE family protein phosphatase [Chthoniobacterales bacterium]